MTIRAEGLRMLVVSAASFATGFVLTILGKEVLQLTASASYNASILICTVGNFFAYRYYIFRTGGSPMLAEAVKFFPSALGFRVLEMVVFLLLGKTGLDYRIGYMVTSTVGFVLKFVVAKYFVFRSRAR